MNNYQPMSHGLANAYEIAKILLACGIIEQDDLIEVTEQLMDGNFQPKVIYEKRYGEEDKTIIIIRSERREALQSVNIF